MNSSLSVCLLVCNVTYNSSHPQGSVLSFATWQLQHLTVNIRTPRLYYFEDIKVQVVVKCESTLFCGQGLLKPDNPHNTLKKNLCFCGEDPNHSPDKNLKVKHTSGQSFTELLGLTPFRESHLLCDVSVKHAIHASLKSVFRILPWCWISPTLFM